MNPSPGNIDSILNSRRNFLQSLEELAKHVETRLAQVKEILELTSKQDETKQELYQNLWAPRFEDALKKARQFRRLANIRPTICVMGKRGQGKTTLLKNWLGKEENKPGLAELKKLPTGDTDTTAALIRLTASRKGTASYDPRYLHVDLIGSSELPEVTARPNHLPAHHFQLHRQVFDDEVSRNAPFNICRFPSNVVEDDESLRLEVTDGGPYQVSKEGQEAFSDAQWTAKQVRIPVEVGTASEHGYASRLLTSLDIIDAPGADSQAQGKLPEWKAAKNAYVFKTAIEEIDILALVCSSDTSAIQLGGQFQKDIWFPWIDRCEEGAGRLVMAFTRASVFLHEAKRAIERKRQEAEGDIYDNTATNFAKKIWVNALEPLATRTHKRESFISQLNPETWPPIFFFEAEDSELKVFREGIPAESGEQMATRLCQLLDASPQEPAEEEENLSLGESCILYLAREWNRFSQGASDRIQPVKHWMIRAFCALLDPHDRSYGLLTDCVFQYATIGPVATNHARERYDYAHQLYRTFTSLLQQIGAPSHRENAIQELSSVRELLKTYWEKNPCGPRFIQGDCCEQRLEIVKQNASPIRERTQEFGNHDMIADVVDDALNQLPIQELGWKKPDRKNVRQALIFCLEQDAFMKKLYQKHAESITQQGELLRRYQTAGLERLVRVLFYLGGADDPQLRLVATHCYQANVDEAELVSTIIERGLCEESDGDRSCMQEVQNTWEQLNTLIDQGGFQPPYSQRSILPSDNHRSETVGAEHH